LPIKITSQSEMIRLVAQVKLKPGAEAIYDEYLRSVAPLMREFGAEIVAVGAGVESSHANRNYPINAVMRLPNKAPLERFLGDARYQEIKQKFRDPAYEELNLSVFRGREPKKFD
jgi:uncharacterized protein (DUF1330 family)